MPQKDCLTVKPADSQEQGVKRRSFFRSHALLTAAAIILIADFGIVAATSAKLRPALTETTADSVTQALRSMPSEQRSDAVDDMASQDAVATAPTPVEVAPPAAPPAPVVTEPRITLVRAAPRLAAFQGLSTWIDLWDTGLSAESQVDRAAAAGVQTIFVQSARFNSPAHIHYPARLTTTIDRAKQYGLKVMVWYIPDFLDEKRDLERSLAAANFTTPAGNRADAFGLDIEMEKQRDVAERSARLIRLSQRIRHAMGPDYPMSAIVLPPLQLDMRPSWWPNFPWREIAPFYDVWIPMSYSSYRGTDPQTTYRWNLHNILETRVRVGDPNLPIHMAGGIADNLPHVDAFVAAVRDGLSLGGGLYDLHTTRPEAWPVLRHMRAEPLT